jgi:hypothetical protein
LLCPQEIGELGFAIKIGEEGRKIGGTGLRGIERIKRRVDGGSALGVDHFARRIEKSHEPGAWQLLANQTEVDAHFAVTTGTAGEMLAALEYLDGDAEAH